MKEREPGKRRLRAHSEPRIERGTANPVGSLLRADAASAGNRDMVLASAPPLIADGLPLPSAIAKDDPHLLKKLPTIGAAEAPNLAQQWLYRKNLRRDIPPYFASVFHEWISMYTRMVTLNRFQGPCWRVYLIIHRLIVMIGRNIMSLFIWIGESDIRWGCKDSESFAALELVE